MQTKRKYENISHHKKRVESGETMKPRVDTTKKEEQNQIISHIVREITCNGSMRVDKRNLEFLSHITTLELLVLGVKFCIPEYHRNQITDSEIVKISEDLFTHEFEVSKNPKFRVKPSDIDQTCVREQEKLKSRIDSKGVTFGKRRKWKFFFEVFEKVSLRVYQFQPENPNLDPELKTLLSGKCVVQPIRNQLEVLEKEKARIIQISTLHKDPFALEYKVRDKVKSIGKKCTLFKKLDNDVVQCINCFHHCVLNPGPPDNPNPHISDPRASIGICGIRHNYRGELYLMDHSRIGTICVDHIEKTPYFHFHPNSKVYFVGMTGCNFRCSFCISWETAQVSKIYLKRRKNAYLTDIEEPIKTAQESTPEDVCLRAKEKQCPVIQYNVYNEATCQFDNYFVELAKYAKKEGFINVVCTNGYQSVHSIELVAPYIDSVNIGLKSIRNGFYSRFCGARVKPILRNIKIWRDMGVWVEIQTLLIPGENDSDKDIADLCDFIVSVDPDIPVHFSKYRVDYKFEKDKNHSKETTAEIFDRAYKIARRCGVKYCYVEGLESYSTLCPDCEKIIVHRGWKNGHWETNYDGMDDSGNCTGCGLRIVGIWSQSIQNPLCPRKNKIPEKYLKFELEKNDGKSVDVKILFASQTGVSEEFAHVIARRKPESCAGISVKVVDLMEYDESKFFQEKSAILVVTSTYFFGRIPRNGERFYKLVMGLSSEKDKKKLEKVKYAVFGIGSTGDKLCHQLSYQVVARELDKKLEELGARRFLQLSEANKKDGFKETLDKFVITFWKTMSTEEVKK